MHYEYDALGNRIASIENGVRTDFLIDPAGLTWLFGEYSTRSNAVYVRGDGITARVGDGDAHYFHYDLVGNTQLMTDASANVSDTYEYLPFGEVIDRSGTTENHITFNGQAGVVASSLADTYYMRNRNYISRLGRFMELDPIDFESGETNLYRFALNDPNINLDPSGLTSLPPLPAAADVLSTRVAQAIAQNAVINNSFGALSSEAIASEFIVSVSGTGPGAKTALFDEFVTSVSRGPRVTPARATGLVGLAFAAGWYKGRQYDIVTDYLFPEQKNAFRDTFARLPIGRGLDDPDSPIYDNGGVNDTAFNDFVRKNMEDPVVRAIAQRFIRDGEDPREAVLRARRLVRNHGHLRLKKESEVVRPSDPNNIIAPGGAGADVLGDPEVQRTRFDGFIRPEGLYQYDIHFENKPDATAPAQTIIVTHTIDEALDLNTFQLRAFGFGDTVVDVPAGRANYYERVDVSDTLNVVVDFEAILDTTTRELTITFTSLDPVTFDLPSDPFAGFLPPNETAPEGDGFIAFTIEPANDLAEGTQIDAVATIVFDTEDAINTPDVSNIIDVTAPTSQVDALPSAVTTLFDVSWSGDDANGSGIESFHIYVSENDGPFEIWLEDTTEMSTTFNGTIGSTYSFYSIASDPLNHVEVVDGTADASTLIATGPWTNPIDSFDVNRIDGVTALDALTIIIELADRRVSDPVTMVLDAEPPAGSATTFYDVSMDGKVTAVDALRVINEIARREIIREGEEFAAATSLDASSVSSRILDEATLPEELDPPTKIRSFGNSIRPSSLVTASDIDADATNVPNVDEVFRHRTNWKSFEEEFESVDLHVATTATLAHDLVRAST